MSTSNLFQSVSLIIVSTLACTFVQAQGGSSQLASRTGSAYRDSQKDYTEVTYDELLTELSSQKTHLVKETTKSPFDTVMIHAGLGYINSFSSFKTSGQTMNRYQNGLQLSLGIDLFSPSWYSEGIFRNYGTSAQGTEEINLKEFDLKVGYKAPVNYLWSYSLSTGLANRFLKISDSPKNINVNDTTPSLILSGGFFAQPAKNISLGIELNARSPLVSSTADKDSFDFALRVITSL